MKIKLIETRAANNDNPLLFHFHDTCSTGDTAIIVPSSYRFDPADNLDCELKNHKATIQIAHKRIPDLKQAKDIYKDGLRDKRR